MSDTPRTDSYEQNMAPYGVGRAETFTHEVVPAHFARQLERELSTAYADIVRLHETVAKLSEALRAEKQRVFEQLGEIDRCKATAQRLIAEQNSNAWWDAQNKL